MGVCNWKWDFEIFPQELAQYCKGQFSNFEKNPIALAEEPFPNDYILAKFSAIVYKSKEQYAEKKHELPNGWEFLVQAESKKTGYFGAAFYNPATRQVVVAHRGTDITNLKALRADIQLAFNKKHVGQADSAITFSHVIRTSLEQSFGKNNEWQLSITGHSLGAWLAQVSTFSVKYLTHNSESDECFCTDDDYLKNYHAHTVVFESPGCRSKLEQIHKDLVDTYKQGPYGNYKSLDMTVYLAKFNAINSCHEQVGTIFQIDVDSHGINSILNLFDKTTFTIKKTKLLQFTSGKLSSIKNTLNYFSILRPFLPKDKFKTVPCNDTEYSLNVFNETELTFVKTLSMMGGNNFDFNKYPRLSQFKDLINFKLNEHDHLIASEKVLALIAKIKRFKQKTILFEILDEDAHMNGYEIKSNMLFETIDNYKLYDFVDKYQLQQFLEDGHKNITYIQMANSQGLQIETSIICNVLKRMQTNGEMKHLFEEKGCLFLKSDDFQVNDDKLTSKLLVIYFETEIDEETVKAYLEYSITKQVKIVILAPNGLDLQKYKSVARPNCKKPFEMTDLTEEAQHVLLSKKLLQLGQETYCLNDIVTDKEVAMKILSSDILKDLLLFENEVLQLNNLPKSLSSSYISPQIREEIKHDLITQFSTQLAEEVSKYVFVCSKDDLYSHRIFSGSNNVLFRDSEDDDEILQANGKKIIYFIKSHNERLFLEKFFHDTYIPRKIIYRKCVSFSIVNLFRKTAKNNTFIIYRRREENTPQHVEQLKKHKNVRVFDKKSQAVEKYHSLRKRGKTVHLLLLDVSNKGEFLVWIRSSDNIDAVRAYLKSEQYTIRDSEIVDRHFDQISIIADEPGAGKSTLLMHILNNLQDKCWTFVVALRNHLSALQNLSIPFDGNPPSASDINTSFDNIAEFLTNSSNSPNRDIIRDLLKVTLEKKSELSLYVFLDGFDELHGSKAQNKLMKLMLFLERHTTAKMVLTSRENRTSYLEKNLSTFVSHLQPVEEFQQINYLASCWHAQLLLFQKNTSKAELHKFAQKLLEKVKETIGESISDFIGIPLQMKFLVEIVNPLKYLVSEWKVTDALHLFQRYIYLRYNIFFTRFTNINIYDENYIFSKWFVKDITWKHCKLAAMQLFQQKMRDGHVSKNAILENDDIMEMNNVGLVQSGCVEFLDRATRKMLKEEGASSEYFDIEWLYDFRNTKFLHESIANYFMAYLLMMWLRDGCEITPNLFNVQNFIILKLFTKPEHKIVRFFLNIHLKSCTVSKTQRKKCIESAEKLWNVVDTKIQETIFHVVAREDLAYVLSNFLIRILNVHENRADILKQRNEDNETAISVAVDKNIEMVQIFFDCVESWREDEVKQVLLSTFFKNFVTKKHMQDVSELIKRKSHYSKISKEINIIKKHMPLIEKFISNPDKQNINSVLKQFKDNPLMRSYLLEVKNDPIEKKTVLHLAAESGQLDVVKTLIKLQCDLNAMDHHSMTPLARASRAGHLEVVKVLVFAGASHNISDGHNKFPITHAAIAGHLNVMMYLDENFEINFRERDRYHMTPLMWAVKQNDLDIVKYLLEKEATTINVMDVNGHSALFHAFKSNDKNKQIISYLIDNKADINTENDYGETILQYSIKKNKWDFVDLLLDKNVNIKFEDLKSVNINHSIKKKDITYYNIIPRMLIKIDSDILSKAQLAEVNRLKKQYCK